MTFILFLTQALTCLSDFVEMNLYFSFSVLLMYDWKATQLLFYILYSVLLFIAEKCYVLNGTIKYEVLTDFFFYPSFLPACCNVCPLYSPFRQ